MTAPSTPTAPTLIVCGDCTTTWTAGGAAHCSACHRLFSTPRLFDLHRSTKGGEHGSCLAPDLIANASGDRLLFLRDGMWRGPEMTEEQKLARFGAREVSA